jgi:hypothetical protein
MPAKRYTNVHNSGQYYDIRPLSSHRNRSMARTMQRRAGDTPAVGRSARSVRSSIARLRPAAGGLVIVRSLCDVVTRPLRALAAANAPSRRRRAQRRRSRRSLAHGTTARRRHDQTSLAKMVTARGPTAARVAFSRSRPRAPHRHTLQTAQQNPNAAKLRAVGG